MPDLSALADRFDLFLLDVFGVLDNGETAIPGAARRIAEKDRNQAHARWHEVADSLRGRFRDVAELMGEAEHDVLAWMAHDESLRSKLRGTNPLERVNKEIKRRANVVGIFPNRAAVVRLVGALMLEQSYERALSRRYMPVDRWKKPSAVCNDPDTATMIAAR
ncbi:transposase [Jhaorihella thermophila]